MGSHKLGRFPRSGRRLRLQITKPTAGRLHFPALHPVLRFPWPPAGATLSARMARWGVAIVLAYGLVALLTPLLIHLGVLADPNAGLANPIYAPPSLAHWCGTDR